MNTQIIRPPAFQKPSGGMRLANDQLNLTSGIAALVEFDRIIDDFTDGIEDTVNHRIKPGVAGFYSIVGQVGLTSVVADKLYGLHIRINPGLRIFYKTSHASLAQDIHPSLTIPSIFISDIQYVELYAICHADVDTVDIVSADYNTFLILQRVR